MGWSGGTFTRVHDWTEDEAGGYDILSTRFDEEDDNFEAGINNCLTKDGSNSPTNDLPMNGRKHTGVATAQDYDQYATAGQVQDGRLIWPITGITGGSLNAYTLTLLMAPSGYVGGQTFSFKADRSNSGATTLNVNGLGAKNVYSNGAPCAGGEIVIGRVYTAIYDGTQFHLVSGGGGSGASFGGAKVCLSSDQWVDHGSLMTVTFRTELYDDSNYYSPLSDGLSIPVTGRYRISGFLLWVFHAIPEGQDWMAGCQLWVNNSRWWSMSPQSTAVASYTGEPYFAMPNISFHWEGDLTAGDLVTVRVAQTNGWLEPSYLRGTGSQDESSWMAIERIK